MAKALRIRLWKKAPFIRLLLPLIAGIILEFYFKFSIKQILNFGVLPISAFILFPFVPEVYRYRYRVFQGLVLSLCITIFGLFINWHKDIRNNPNWYGNHYSDSSFLVVTIAEPPVEKAKSYKALAAVESIVNHSSSQYATGNLLLYFAKDSIQKELQYGDQIIVGNSLQQIKNTGNPGGFDYAQYSAFRQFYHQSLLKNKDWILLDKKNKTSYSSFLFSTREKVVNIIEKYIKGDNESSIAKALLIGYKVDLDKDLVQAYSNAGVVHLIAISGLHMGIIYGVLLWVFSNIPIIRKSLIIKSILIFICLWLFALLTGASPSVLRAAVMFSFIVGGRAVDKHASVYNSMAASAFLLLCINPFILWDVGFQLSYLAVLGIVAVQKPISNWFNFKNKLIQSAWKLAAVSLAAQLFTFPICLYYFHQLPLLFLLANIIAIPLATWILWGCLILVFISPINFIAFYFGKIISGLLWLLNKSVTLINGIPFSLWEGVLVTFTETILLYLITACFSYAMVQKNKYAFKMAMTFSIILISLNAFYQWENLNQKKMIVYNIGAHKAIDFIAGNEFLFIGDSNLMANPLLENYSLKPSRIFFKANNKIDFHKAKFQQDNFYLLQDKKIFMMDTTIMFSPLIEKIKVDYIIISKNPAINVANLAQAFECNQYIFDASNSFRKIEKWKKECEELHLHFHSVSEQGAFVTNL